MELPFSIHITTPWLFICMLPVIALLIWRLRRNVAAGSFHFSGLEYLTGAGLRLAVNKRRYRALLLLLLSLLIALAWISPEIRTNRPLSIGPSRELNPVFLFALDVSASMTEPLGGYVIQGMLNLDGATRFEAARERVLGFVAAYPRAKFGLILFSVQPMLVRWPTLETEYDFREILGEGMRFTNPDRKRPSQLARFAGGTSTRTGLLMANDVLMQQGGSSKSLILIADFIDDTEDVIEGIQNINLEDIYTHILAVDAQEQNLEVLKAAFKDDANMRIYTIKSPDDMDDAFAQIVETETIRQQQAGSRNFAQNFRWLICLAGFGVAVFMVMMFETRLHKTESPRTAARVTP